MSTRLWRAALGYTKAEQGMNRQEMAHVLSSLFPSNSKELLRMKRKELNKFCHTYLITKDLDLKPIEVVLTADMNQNNFGLQSTGLTNPNLTVEFNGEIPSFSQHQNDTLRGPQVFTITIPLSAVDSTNYPTLSSPSIPDYQMTSIDIDMIQTRLSVILNRDYKNKWLYHPFDITGTFDPDTKQVILQITTTTGVINLIKIFNRVFGSWLSYVICKNEEGVAFMLHLLRAECNVRLPTIVQYGAYNIVMDPTQQTDILNYLEQEMNRRLPGRYVIDIHETSDKTQYGSHRIYIGKFSDNEVPMIDYNSVRPIYDEQKIKYIATLNAIIEEMSTVSIKL